ncbi:GNAT family N-acetyltransferase [Priestia koreensis]|uniref:GNAT family N-acetyltransferase n=1 Tax=Priestia koreensis TaxID=284581 RepID=UPI003015A234
MKYNKDEKTIETKRLRLRLFQQTDAETVTDMCNNYNLYKNTLYLPYPYTLEDATHWIKTQQQQFVENRHFEFAVTNKESGELYGAIALSNQQVFDHGELAYWIGEKHWGNGYATEAAKALVEFAFDEKGYHKVFARYFDFNEASGKVLEKIGMRKEGILREHVKKRRKLCGPCLYGNDKSVKLLNYKKEALTMALLFLTPYC